MVLLQTSSKRPTGPDAKHSSVAPNSEGEWSRHAHRLTRRDVSEHSYGRKPDFFSRLGARVRSHSGSCSSCHPRRLLHQGRGRFLQAWLYAEAASLDRVRKSPALPIAHTTAPNSRGLCAPLNVLMGRPQRLFSGPQSPNPAPSIIANKPVGCGGTPSHRRPIHAVSSMVSSMYRTL